MQNKTKGKFIRYTDSEVCRYSCSYSAHPLEGWRLDQWDFFNHKSKSNTVNAA
jgi:hypothetical protein